MNISTLNVHGNVTYIVMSIQLKSFRSGAADGNFGQPSTSKVTAEVAVGDIERSAEAKDIMKIVTEHAIIATANGSKAVIMYNHSLISMIQSINHGALMQALEQENGKRPKRRFFEALGNMFCMNARKPVSPPVYSDDN